MMKLIYPDGKMTDEEAYELVDFAAECRKRVKDQLYVIDETFMAEPARFKYINLKTGIEMNVETLEEVSHSKALLVSRRKKTPTVCKQMKRPLKIIQMGKIFQIVMEQNDLVFLFYKRKA